MQMNAECSRFVFNLIGWLLDPAPDCDVPALGVGLHGAGLLRDLHRVLHGLLEALGLSLHHLALVFGANLSLDLSYDIQR